MNLRVLTNAILDPGSLAAATLTDWDRLVRLARRARLLATLGVRIDEAGMRSVVPAAVLTALDSERVLADANRRAVGWEAHCLRRALESLALPVVLLKGAAYAVADLPPANGRLFGDIDLLVPRERLAEVERVLGWHGWDGGAVDDYDQRYYRTWMHELPPMIHRKRESVLDVHHTILPPTARYHPDPAKLQADALEVEGWPGIKILAPADMVLHSACHLFHEGEWDHGLRDLYDLHCLLEHFAAAPEFWPRLSARALEMELARPLGYALRYCRWIWGTAVPDSVLSALAPQAPNILVRALMDRLMRRALKPMHTLAASPGDGVARFCLYVRGHWLRMPYYLLIPHLLRKALKPRPKAEAS